MKIKRRQKIFKTSKYQISILTIVPKEKGKKMAEFQRTWSQLTNVFFFFSKIIFNAKQVWNVRIDG